MSSVGGIHRCGCEAPQSAYQIQARASYRERSTQTAGALSVRTDDGDVVDISFASQTSESVGRYSATDGANRVSGVERTSSSAFAVEVSVEGTLDDDEVEDISKLLRKLASQVHNPNPHRIERQFERLDSLESFQFGFEHTRSVSFESVEVLEGPLPPVIAPETPPEVAPVDKPAVGSHVEQTAAITFTVSANNAMRRLLEWQFAQIESSSHTRIDVAA